MQDESTGRDSAPGPPEAPPPILPAGPPGRRLNPWFSIWTLPRETMRQILDDNPRRMVITLTLLVGVVTSLTFATLPQLPGALPRLAVALAGILIAPLVSLVALFIGGFLVGVTGRWLEGTGDSVAVRAALAWSYVPGLWIFLLFSLPQNLVLGRLGGGAGDLPYLLANPALLLVTVVFGAIGLGLAVWQIVIKMKCLGEAHRFSAWRGLGAYVLAWLIVLAVPAVPLVAFGVLFLLLRS